MTWFRKAREENNLIWSSLHKGITEDNYTIALSVPVYDYSDNFMGVLGAEVSLDSINQLINWEIQVDLDLVLVRIIFLKWE